MSNSIPATTILPGAWVSAYALSGLAVGSAIRVQNLTQGEPLGLWIGAAAPADGIRGEILPGLQTARLTAGESGLWLKPMGSSAIGVSIQSEA